MAVLSAIAAGVGALGSLGSAIYGSIKSSKYNNQANALLNGIKESNKEWYNTRMSEDYTQRADVQATINKQRELLQQQYNNARRTNAVAGGTDESLALQKAGANASLANTASEIAAGSAAYKQGVEQQYRSADAALAQQQAQVAQQQADRTAQAAGQATNAGLNLIGLGLADTNGVKKDKV